MICYYHKLTFHLYHMVNSFFEKIKFIKCEANNDLPIPFFPENKILFGKFFII